jgi:hypothetical protein
VRQTIHDNLKNVAHAPSVQMQNVPMDLLDVDPLPNDELPPDICDDNAKMSSNRISAPNEYYDSANDHD